MIADIREIKPTITYAVVTVIRLILMMIVGILFFLTTLSSEFQNMKMGVFDIFIILMTFINIITTGIFAFRMKGFKSAVARFVMCKCCRANE